MVEKGEHRSMRQGDSGNCEGRKHEWKVRKICRTRLAMWLALNGSVSERSRDGMLPSGIVRKADFSKYSLGNLITLGLDACEK